MIPREGFISEVCDGQIDLYGGLLGELRSS
jgi:hypothetical protein